MSAPEIASASVPETLASLKVNPETGLARAEVDVRRQQNGYNEVAATKRHPVLKFLGKFWGISAWMLEPIMVLSAVLGKYSDLVVVGMLLVINAVLSFMQTIYKRQKPKTGRFVQSPGGCKVHGVYGAVVQVALIPHQSALTKRIPLFL